MEIQASSEEGEDKKFVSLAVAFVIGHARNGFVPLCASVASLLKEQAKLKQQLNSLEQECLCLKESISQTNNLPDRNNGKNKEINRSSKSLMPRPCRSINTHETSAKTFSKNSVVKCSSQLPYRNLKDCLCNQCSQNRCHPSITVPIEKGVKVVIRGEICGVVLYVGHLDSQDFPEVYVGIKLSEAAGNSDGSIGNKVYFSVPKNYGMFVPLSHIHCIMKTDAKK